MEFKLDYGPWETVFAGQTYGHEVEIVSNPENFFIVIIYDKREGRNLGAVIEGYKAFFARGQMEAFIQTIPKPSFGITKSVGGKTGKIFFLSFDPFYVDFRQEDFVRKIDLAMQRTEENVETIMNLARASSLDLKELSVVAKSDYATLLGDPFFIKLLASGSGEPALSKLDLGKPAYGEEEKGPAIQLGLGKKREVIKENISNLRRTQIIGQGAPLLYASYILAENMLLENIPVVILDSFDYFAGFGRASTDSFALKDELVEYEPFGFPMKQVKAKDSMKLALKDTDMFLLLDIIGLSDSEFQKNMSLLSVAMRAATPMELAERVLESKEIGDYEKLRVERMLNIISKKFPDFFGNETPAGELVRAVPGKIGRVVVIDTKHLGKDEKILFMHTLMRQITKSFTQTQQAEGVLVLPEAELLFAQNKERATIAISRLENRGMGIILGTQSELPAEIDQTLSAKMNIVAGRDVAVSMKAKRNYRVILRPSISGKPKAE
ncbi:Uncharacterised protein [uncultured archaeon]|nr:Uncharacterised protein [uncultured archaeon]